jgi:hypothetical protein
VIVVSYNENTIHGGDPEPEPNYEQYEQEKSELPDDLTPDEYEEAVREIADANGV